MTPLVHMKTFDPYLYLQGLFKYNKTKMQIGAKGILFLVTIELNVFTAQQIYLYPLYPLSLLHHKCCSQIMTPKDHPIQS